MSFRRIAAAGIGVALLVTLAACGSKSGGTGALSGGPVASTPATSTPTSTSPTPAPAVTVTVTPTAPATPAYPADYFAAILAAWKAHDTSYLTLLTSASTAAQFYGFGNINQTWHGAGAEGAMGTTYETFFNNAGDALTLRSANQETAAKHWHAGGINAWDKMTFPTDPVTYVRHFVNAWIAGNTTRMKLLSGAALTAQVTAITPVPASTYTTTGDGAAGHTYVEVKDPTTALDITLVVVNMYAGQQHAIESCQTGC